MQRRRVFLLVGDETTSYRAGEVWHLFDTQVQMPLTMVETNRLSQTDIDEFSVVILAGGTYSTLDSSSVAKLKDWTAKGGTLVAIGDAVPWAASSGVCEFDFVPPVPQGAKIELGTQEEPETLAVQKPYAQSVNNKAREQGGGCIVHASIDMTHPLCFGYESSRLPLFSTGRVFLEPSNNVYCNPVAYCLDPLLSGYMPASSQRRLEKAVAVRVVGRGTGRVVLMAEPPNFRGYWYGTRRLLTNAVFFGGGIKIQ